MILKLLTRTVNSSILCDSWQPGRVYLAHFLAGTKEREWSQDYNEGNNEEGDSNSNCLTCFQNIRQICRLVILSHGKL